MPHPGSWAASDAPNVPTRATRMDVAQEGPALSGLVGLVALGAGGILRAPRFLCCFALLAVF